MLSATNAVGITFNYAYDAAARLTTMTTNFVDGSHPGTLFSNAQYGPIGLTSATLGNGLSETLAYMNRGWLKSYSATSGSTTRYSFSVGTFAPNGDILAANDSANGNWTYTYDAFNRIIGSNQNSGQAVYSYDYDRFGNRWHQNGPHSAQLSFDANNRIVAGSGVTYDSAGNVTADGSHTYSYDAENRLVSVDSGSTASYVYDGAGRRVRKATSSAGSVDFLYDLGGNEVAEVGPGGVFNRGELYLGSRHLATYTSGQSGATFFTHSDWLGTERARTDVSGALAESCTSLPFGDALSCSSTDVSPMHFTGDERDSESSLDHTWFRQYSSQFARWTVPDPAGLAAVDPSNPQSWNRYSYVGDDPMNFVDPFGLFTQGPCNYRKLGCPGGPANGGPPSDPSDPPPGDSGFGPSSGGNSGQGGGGGNSSGFFNRLKKAINAACSIVPDVGTLGGGFDVGIPFGSPGLAGGIAANGSSGELSLTGTLSINVGLILPDAYVYAGAVFSAPTNASLNSSFAKPDPLPQVTVAGERFGVVLTPNSYQITAGPSFSPVTVAVGGGVTKTTPSIPYLGYLANPTRAACKLITGK